MTTKVELHDEALLRQALEALESSDWYIGQLEWLVYSPDDTEVHEERAKVQSAIAALRERLGWTPPNEHAQQSAAPSARQTTGITTTALGYALKRATPAQVIEYLEDDVDMHVALSNYFEEQHNQQPAAVAAIQFALTAPEGMTFLRLWNEGEFDTIRREWPNAPSEVYVGVDPLIDQHQEDRNG